MKGNDVNQIAAGPANVPLRCSCNCASCTAILRRPRTFRKLPDIQKKKSLLPQNGVNSTSSENAVLKKWFYLTKIKKMYLFVIFEPNLRIQKFKKAKYLHNENKFLYESVQFTLR